mmetsp:Transcript_4562/g.9729  ORF Transcript_4562/g.9729 Transcript_4562/m.9729 type:complete len:181 (-) Transcript_4562:132-674(-)
MLTCWETAIPALPHVIQYEDRRRRNPLLQFIQSFWKLMDALLRYTAWVRAGRAINKLRKQRGLTPLSCGLVSYFRQYPSICFGGTGLFRDPHITIPAHVTPIGALESTSCPRLDQQWDKSGEQGQMGDLKTWLDKSNGNSGLRNGGIVYAGFGTGTILTPDEASNLAGDLVHALAQEGRV